jgi:hypothetical protein
LGTPAALSLGPKKTAVVLPQVQHSTAQQSLNRQLAPWREQWVTSELPGQVVKWQVLGPPSRLSDSTYWNKPQGPGCFKNDSHAEVPRTALSEKPQSRAGSSLESWVSHGPCGGRWSQPQVEGGRVGGNNLTHMHQDLGTQFLGVPGPLWSFPGL